MKIDTLFSCEVISVFIETQEALVNLIGRQIDESIFYNVILLYALYIRMFPQFIFLVKIFKEQKVTRM